jgi:acyl-CoA synthetase (AMP-forming)/AMP-acid ligase II
MTSHLTHDHAATAERPRLAAATERLRLWREPRAATLLEVLELPAASCPNLIAVHLLRPDQANEELTYGRLWRSALRAGARLRRAGLRAGDRAVLALPTSREFFEMFFGILVAGGIPVPCAPTTSVRGSRFAAYLEAAGNLALDAGASLFVCTPKAADALRPGLTSMSPHTRIFCGTDATGETVDEAELIAPARAAPSETALLQYTSGSTSRPKGVVLTHRNIISNAEAVAATFVTPETVCVSWLPLYHDMGLIGTFLMSLYCRTPVVLMPPQSFIKDPASWLRAISDFRATATVAPNFAFGYAARAVAPEALEGVRLDGLEVALNGAEPVDLDAVEKFQERFAPYGLRAGVVRPVYGLAESSLAVTFADPGRLLVDEVDAGRLEHEGLAAPADPGARARRFVSVGRPLPTQEVRVVDAHLLPLPERRVGEVWVRGPSVMRGYYQRPEETEDALRGGWLRTGDLGYLARGRLYLTGRSKDLIIRYGRNYYPQDIERLTTRVEGVAEGGAVAFGVERGAETLVVVVAETRLRDGERRRQLVRRIREACQDSFLFGPDDVRLFVPGGIPRTTSGKVRRLACKQMYLDSAPGAG